MTTSSVVAASPPPSLALIPRQAFLGVVELPNVGLDPLTGEEKFASPVEVVSLEDAFTKSWSDDQHLLGYLTDPFDSTEPFFRLNLDVVPEILRTGARVLQNYVCVEFDTPGHVPWTSTLWEAFLTVYEPLCSSDALGPLLRSAVAFYTTRCGVRWVFRLDPAVSVGSGDKDDPNNEASQIIWGLVEKFRVAGLMVDTCADGWNRCFRLPRVNRGGSRSEADPFFVCVFNRDGVTDSRSLPRAKSRASDEFVATDNVTVDVGAHARPSRDEALALLEYYDDQGRAKQTTFAKAADRQLHGRPYHKHLFNLEPIVIPDETSRHDTIMKWVASATAILFTIEGASPEAIFALFLKQVEQLEGRDFPRDTWRQVLWSWQSEAKERAAKTLAEATAKVAEVERIATATEVLYTGIRAWYPNLPKDPVAAHAWMKQHAIVAVDSKYHVLKRDGRYCKLPVAKDHIVSQIVRLGMEDMIPLVSTDESGTEKLMSHQEILARYCVVATTTEAIPEIEGGYLTALESENPRFVTTSFRRRRDLVPEFSPDVDLWLQAMGGAKYETLCRQLGCFLAFERGAVAAMSFVAPSGAGKKLLMHGLMECLEVPALATVRDLVERFNEGLLISPFLSANEGFPMGKGHSHPSDTFRQVTTGDGIAVDRKNKPIVMVKNPMRVVFTANNHNLILKLCEGRDLAPADREAIAIRIIHYEPGMAPVNLLLAKGGFSWTDGWIAGDSPGQESRFTVAKHFLWLHQKYGANAKPYGRHGLLLEGEIDSPVLRMMQTQGGGSPVVAEVLVSLLKENQPNPEKVKYLTDGRFLVTASAILEHWREKFAPTSHDRLNLKRIHDILKGWIVGHRTSVEGVPGRWNEIDVPLLASEAEKHGWTCQRLSDLVKAHQGSKVLA